MFADLKIIYKDKVEYSDIFVCYDMSEEPQSVYGYCTPKEYIIQRLAVMLRGKYRYSDILLSKQDWQDRQDEYNINGVLTFEVIADMYLEPMEVLQKVVIEVSGEAKGREILPGQRRKREVTVE